MCVREISWSRWSLLLFQIQKYDLVVFRRVTKGKSGISDKSRETACKSELDSQPRSGFLKRTAPQIVEKTMLDHVIPQSTHAYLRPYVFP